MKLLDVLTTSALIPDATSVNLQMLAGVSLAMTGQLADDPPGNNFFGLPGEEGGPLSIYGYPLAVFDTPEDCVRSFLEMLPNHPALQVGVSGADALAASSALHGVFIEAALSEEERGSLQDRYVMYLTSKIIQGAQQASILRGEELYIGASSSMTMESDFLQALDVLRSPPSNLPPEALIWVFLLASLNDFGFVVGGDRRVHSTHNFFGNPCSVDVSCAQLLSGGAIEEYPGWDAAATSFLSLGQGLQVNWGEPEKAVNAIAMALGGYEVSQAQAQLSIDRASVAGIVVPGAETLAGATGPSNFALALFKNGDKLSRIGIAPDDTTAFFGLTLYAGMRSSFGTQMGQYNYGAVSVNGPCQAPVSGKELGGRCYLSYKDQESGFVAMIDDLIAASDLVKAMKSGSSVQLILETAKVLTDSLPYETRAEVSWMTFDAAYQQLEDVVGAQNLSDLPWKRVSYEDVKKALKAAGGDGKSSTPVLGVTEQKGTPVWYWLVGAAVVSGVVYGGYTYWKKSRAA